MNKVQSLIILLLLTCPSLLLAKDYNASLFGIKSDGITLNTRSIQKAINFISEKGGGRLVFYVGRYLTGSVQLLSNVTIQLEEGAVLLGANSVYDYADSNSIRSLIGANEQHNIGITGKGIIEGGGAALLQNINGQIQKGHLDSTGKYRPALIFLNDCSNVILDQITLRNACGNVQVFTNCRNLIISNITVQSTAVADSEGMILVACNAVKLSDAFFDTSGQNLRLKGKSKNITIEDSVDSNGKKVRPSK